MPKYIARKNVEYSLLIEADSLDEAYRKACDTDLTNGDAAWSDTEVELESAPAQCPYCHAEVENTKEARYVNGIRPLRSSKGCEFCNPTGDDE